MSCLQVSHEELSQLHEEAEMKKRFDAGEINRPGPYTRAGRSAMFIDQALTPDLRQQLGGVVRSSSMLVNKQNNPIMSGKMVQLLWR